MELWYTSRRTGQQVPMMAFKYKKKGLRWAFYVCFSGCGPEPKQLNDQDSDGPPGSSEDAICLEENQTKSFSKEAIDVEGERTSPAPHQSKVEANTTSYQAETRRIHASRHDFHFPSSSLLSTSDTPSEEIARLKSFLEPEIRRDASGSPEMFGVHPAIKVDLYWNGATTRETDQIVKLDISVVGSSSGRFEISRGSHTQVVLRGPMLNWCQGHMLADGTDCDGLKSSAEVEVILSAADLLCDTTLSTLGSELTISLSFALCGDDLTDRKERALNEMRQHARTAQVHIRAAQGHATLAEHSLVAHSLSVLHDAVAQKISSSSLQNIQSLVSPDDIPPRSAIHVTPTNGHLQDHLMAMARSLQSASFAAERSHRLFLRVNATSHLKVE